MIASTNPDGSAPDPKQATPAQFAHPRFVPKTPKSRESGCSNPESSNSNSCVRARVGSTFCSPSIGRSTLGHDASLNAECNCFLFQKCFFMANTERVYSIVPAYFAG